MRLYLGKVYTVLKTDGSIITFKFIGGEKPSGEINGKEIDLYLILTGGYLSYWEEE